MHGLGLGMQSLSRLVLAKTRSISPENFDGAKGGGGRATDGTGREAARGLGPDGDGRGWKVSPCITIDPGETRTIAEIDGPGVIQQIWMTPTGTWRYSILRVYYDDAEHPSIECPVGDFFANGWNVYAHVNSLAVCVNPGSAFNCYWPMPFRKKLRITIENLDDEKVWLFYQVNYCLQEVGEDEAYFHAQFRRRNPVPRGEVYTILDGVEGQGHYLGTYMCWGVNDAGWWGEGEVKFYLDGDIPPGSSTRDAVAEHGGHSYPTICGTGTEDYFCGSYNFEHQATGQYQEFTTAYAGLPQVIRPDGLYNSQQRFGLYRWHLMDPVRFETDLQVTVQALGWRHAREKRYRALSDDLASVAYWYQHGVGKKFPPLPSRDELEVTIGGGPFGGAPKPG